MPATPARQGPSHATLLGWKKMNRIFHIFLNSRKVQSILLVMFIRVWWKHRRCARSTIMHSSFRQLFDWLQWKIVATKSTTMMNGENLHSITGRTVTLCFSTTKHQRWHSGCNANYLIWSQHGDVVVVICFIKGTQLIHKIDIPTYAFFGFAWKHCTPNSHGRLPFYLLKWEFW